MIKKLLAFSILIIAVAFTFSFTSNAEIEEVEGVITWGNTGSPVAGVHYMYAEGDIPTNAQRIKILIPISYYHEYIQSGIEAYIAIRNSSNVTIVSAKLPTVCNLIDGVLTMNLLIYLDEDERAEMDNFYLFIPQNYGSTPSGYLTYLDSNSHYYYYKNYEPTFEEQITWRITEESSVLTASSFSRVSYFTYTVAVALPVSEYSLMSSGSVNARVEFYNSEYTLLGTQTFSDNEWSVTGIINMRLTDYFTVGSVRYIRVVIPQDFTVIPNSNYITWFNENSTIQFNGSIIRYNFWVAGETDYTYLGSPNFIEYLAPDPSDIGALEFSHWKSNQNTTVNLGDPILNTWLDLNGDLNLYAQYYLFDTADVDILPNPDNAIINMLDAFGMNNDIGKTIFYVVIVLGATLLMLAFNIPLFVVTLVDMLLTGLLLYIGVVSMLIAIIMFSIFTLMTIISFKSGGVSYE